MSLLRKAVIAASLGAGVVTLSSASASAAIVCNEDTCWHATERYDYPSDVHVTIHDDNWKWGSNEHFSFKEHEGRGYWHRGSWKTW
jgi:hypothetical protein